MKHNFEERKENRKEYAEKQAAKNKEKSEALYNQASKMASAIPFGQPILVGHHSEKRDRNYRNKIHNTFGKAFEAQDKANYYESKADSIKSNTAIFSDDPQALEKLKAKLSSLQANQEFMKAANKCIKKKDKDAFLLLPFATPELWDELNTPDYLNRVGFPSYSLQNNNSNMTRIKQRIAQMEKQLTRPTTEIQKEGVRLVQNTEANRVQLIFDSIPSEEIRKKLKGCGFRWCRSEMAWQRHLTPQAVYIAQNILETL